MKKLVLFILSVMAFAGMSMAQDVWSAGYFTEDDTQQAVVYKNGTRLHATELFNGYYGECTGVDVYQDDVYWVRNVFTSSGTFYYADIMKNDGYYLNAPSGQGRHIYDLHRYSGVLCATGCMDINNVRTAVAWREDDPNPGLIMGDCNFESVAYGSTVYDGSYFTCGYQYSSASTYGGVIWKEGHPLYYFANYTKLYDIAYSNGYLYTVGADFSGSAIKLRVWKTSVTGETNIIEYTLADDMNSNYVDERFSICIDDASDIYVNGMSGSSEIIWKNGEAIYEVGNYFTAVIANSDGVYYAGTDGPGFIWKDDEVLYEIEGYDMLTCIFVPEPACDNQVRDLPYFEGFETGATDWACWEVDDEGENGTQPSYWHRGGVWETSPATGDYCAWHGYGPQGHEQEGFLATPVIAIPTGGPVKMTFKTKEESVDSHYQYEGLLVYDGGNMVELWSQSSEHASDTWETVEIDLSAYQGKDIQLAFKYVGTYAHIWYIDDVSIEQEANPGEYFINTTVYPEGAGIVEGGGSYAAGTTVTIVAIPNSGYEFEKWNDENTDNPRQVTVNSNMTFVAFFKGTGIGENEGSLMVLYPNPASNYIRIEGIEANAEVRIYNAMGALVKVVNTNADEEIGISELSAGLYFVRCGNATMHFLKE